MSTAERDVVTQIEQAFGDLNILPVPLAVGRAVSHYSVEVVENYPSPGNKRLDDEGRPFALRYPGERPAAAFSVFGDEVSSGEFTTTVEPGFYVNARYKNGDELVFNIDQLLNSAEAAPMGERFPVIAFGSNANPSQLAQKFDKLLGADKDIVPTLKATVKNVMPVYAARIGINGYVFTDLYPAGDDVQSEVHVNFLSRVQLAAMDATEKAYSLCKMPGVKLQAFQEDGYNTQAYLYVGREDDQGAAILADEAGRPIRLAEITTTGENLDEQFAAMTQAEVHRYIYEIASGIIAENLMLDTLPEDEIELIKIIINRKEDPRLENLRAHIKEHEAGQPLGRVVGRQIQQALAGTNRIHTVSGLRKIIPQEFQDIKIEAAETFAELSKTD